MTHPRDPRARRLRPVPTPAGPEPVLPPASPDLLAGAVRAELLADDWRSSIRAEVAAMQAAAAAEVEAGLQAAAAAGLDAADEDDAEAATEQGDEETEEFCPDCLAGVESSEHYEKCELPDDDQATDDRQAAGEAAAAIAEFGPPPPNVQVEDSAGKEFSDEAGEPDLASLPAGDSWAMMAAEVDGAPVMDWRSRHDERSLTFLVRTQLRVPVPVQDRVWPHGPILNQGTTPPLTPKDASGCTGFATAAALNALGADIGRDEAFELYLGAQHRDHVPGEDYAGTSVLAVMQEAKARGLIGAYLWARGTRDIAQSLLNDDAGGGARFGPVVLGIPWHSAMSVDDAAVLTVGGERGHLGHSIAAIGIVRARNGRPGPWFVLQQSSGPEVGDGGLLYLHHTDLAMLLRGVGEAAVPVVTV